MLPGTEVWSRARTKALFDDEQAFIAPGLQVAGVRCALVLHPDERRRVPRQLEAVGDDERDRLGAELDLRVI